MASVPMVMQRVRRARRECKRPPSRGRFRQYEDEYRRIFEALESVGGEDCLDDVAEWTLEWTRRQEDLPAPAAVRERARAVCGQRDLEVPEGSALAE